MLVHLLKEMFREVTLRKDISKIPRYYHPEFLLYTNETTMDYKTFVKSHEQYYKTPIQYEVAYDEETFFEQKDKVAGRMWVTTKRPGEAETKIELILIAQYKESKLYRLWELTYPDWSQLSAFKDDK